MTYDVGDLIIRIKNGYMARKGSIESPNSTMRERILKKLLSLKYIKDYKVDKDQRKINIELLYHDEVPALTDVEIISKPGRRWYVGYKQLKAILGGLGVSILSTPQGILTNNEARKKTVGGELLFNIW